MDLSRLLGLNVTLNENLGKLEFGEAVTCETDVHISLDEMSPILLNKFLKYPKKVYTNHTNIRNGIHNHQDNDLIYNIIHIPQGLLGIEFARTHIYNSIFIENKFDIVLEVITGEITIFMQKNQIEPNPSVNTKVENVHIIQLNQGNRFAIPTGMMYTFVNTGNSDSIISTISNKNHQPMDYSLLKKEKGLAFYIISKNARTEIVANPKYKVNSQPCQQCINELDESSKSLFLKDFICNTKDSLYMTLQKNIENFSTLLA